MQPSECPILGLIAVFLERLIKNSQKSNILAIPELLKTLIKKAIEFFQKPRKNQAKKRK